MRYADSVKETSVITGTGTYSLAGAVTNFQTFVAGVGTGAQVLYAARSAAGAWETGVGTVTDGAPDTLTRDFITGSSSAGAAVSWPASTTVTIALTMTARAFELLTAMLPAGDPNGFEDRDTAWTLGYTEGTRELSVGPTGASAVYWSNGQKFIRTTAAVLAHPDTEGVHYYYFDDTGTLISTQTFSDDLIKKWCIVYTVYWDAAHKKAIPRAMYEPHGFKQDSEEHYRQHCTVGAVYDKVYGGGTPTVTLGDGSADAHIQVAATACQFWDEDIPHLAPLENSGDNKIKIYRNGANGDWRMEESHSAIMRRGAGRAYYNQWTGTVWQDTECTEGYFFQVYRYAVNSNPVVYAYVQGQGQYATVAEAQAAAQTRPNLGTLPGYEWPLFQTFIVQTSSAYTNTYKSRIVATHDGSGWYDWRTDNPDPGQGSASVGMYLDLPSSNPSAPAAGNVRAFTKAQGGRMMLAMMGPSGLDTVLQPHLAKNGWGLWKPTFTGTGVTAIGAAALSATGTATSAPWAATSLHTRVQRVDYLVTTAATTAVAGVRYGTAVWRGSVGFHHIFRMCPATGVTNANKRCFVGMQAATAAPTDVNPSTLLNIVGVGYDSADANWQVMTNNGTGAAAKIDTGIARPSADRQTMYSIMVFCPPGGAWFGVRIVDENTGDTYESAQLSADIPASTQALTWNCYCSVGGTSSVVGYTFAGHWFDTDN